jgi:5-methylcytosine-specific restriction endonuclease McrA
MSFNPEQKYLVTESKIPIKDFHEYSEDYITRPPYQRKTVWSKKKKENLLDSLFRRYYVPKIVIREVRLSNDKTVREIIDGQQRINVVQEFFENKLKIPKSLKDLHPDLPGKYFSKLTAEFRRFIDREIQYNADIVKNIDDPKNPDHQKIATEIFWRLQQGESLNFMEIAHARLNSLSRNWIVKYGDDISFDYDKYIPIDKNLDKHNFFKVIDRNNDRMQHLMLLTRLLIIEENDGYSELKDTAVVEFIDKYEKPDGIGNYSLENESFAKRTITNMNLFYDIFKNDPMLSKNGGMKEFSREYIIISFYLLIRHLKKYYLVDDKIKKSIYDFLFKFYKRWQAQKDTDIDITTFTSHRQQSQNDLETRDRILRQLFFEYLSNKKIDLSQLDMKRTFNEADKIKIYRDNEGLCQLCLKEGKSDKEATVSWKEFEADHILPHSKGGKTEPWNGQVLCRTHNRRKGNK